MGSYGGAETCEVVGLYILWSLKPLGINMGLYRDDALGVSSKRRQQIECLKKDICAVFENMGLKIEVFANLKTVHFLDVTLELGTGLHKPYLKPNNTLQYVHTSSNHPKRIIEKIEVHSETTFILSENCEKQSAIIAIQFK